MAAHAIRRVVSYFAPPGRKTGPGFLNLHYWSIYFIKTKLYMHTKIWWSYVHIRYLVHVQKWTYLALGWPYGWALNFNMASYFIKEWTIKVVLRLSTTFAPVLQHGRIATIVICLHTLRRASTRKLNRFWQNWHLQRWLIVKSKSKMASRPRQRPSTTEKPTMTFSIKPRLICIITKKTVASTNIALTIRVAVKCHRQRLFSRDTKWPKAKY